MLALWREDYGGAASHFDRVAAALSDTTEHRAFWLAIRALALHLAARHGDTSARAGGRSALRAAATVGAVSTFFTRLRLAEARLEGAAVTNPAGGHDELFQSWDRVIDQQGAQGPRFDRWVSTLRDDLRSADHDTVARTVATVGRRLLGVPAEARRATAGEEDAYWELPSPRRTLSFEVKMAPIAQRTVNDDVEQAEGATRALESERGVAARGVLLTPHSAIDDTAKARLDRVRLMTVEVFAEQTSCLLDVLQDYRRGWAVDSAARTGRRQAVEHLLPRLDWLWRASEHSDCWLDAPTLRTAWGS